MENSVYGTHVTQRSQKENYHVRLKRIICMWMKYPQNYPQKTLEQIRITQRIVFEKIGVMHKGQQRKNKGAICKVPVECDQTCNQLPHQPDRSCIIMLKA